MVRALEGLHSGAEVDKGSQAQEMAAADDMHLEVADNVGRRFSQEQGMDSQDD